MSKTPSDSLFRLICSMSKSEKRHFKLYAGRHSVEENNYLKLFDAIEKQKSYDEGSILKKFSKETFINRFPITKKRLYETVLRSLDAFHSQSSIDAQLKRELHFAEILYKKSLYGQCAKILTSARHTAMKHEKHSSLAEIHHWQKKLIEKDNYLGQNEESISAMLHEDVLIADRMKDFNEYWNIKSRLFLLLNRQGKVRNPTELNNFKKIIDNTLLKNEGKAQSHEARYLFNHIYSAYHFGTGDYKSSYRFLKRNVELIETHPAAFKEEPNIYFSVLTNLIYVSTSLKRYDEVFVLMKKLKSVPETLDTSRNEDLEIKLFSSALSIEITLYNTLSEFEKAIGLVPAIEKGLDRFGDKINRLRKAYFYFNIAVAYFGAEKYSLALRWTNRLFSEPNIDENQDIYCFARILNLIIHIELENDDVVPYILTSTSRYLKTRNRVYKFESVFLEFIEHLIRLNKKEDGDAIYKKLLLNLKKLSSDPYEKTVFEYFDFIAWCKSKIEHTSFREMVIEKTSVIVNK
ncbi:MAG: hypothetical protein NTV09_02530 [Bacteroidetes bacterium]|nr:hypothetical protein [Bacteroidota bacterium]